MMFDPALFLTPQSAGWEQAREEMYREAKKTHWSWFVFPQLPGLGQSENSRMFALLPEHVNDYANHPVLGERLLETFALALGWIHHPDDVLGGLDALKLRSCATLFMHAERRVVAQLARLVLRHVFLGHRCEKTEEIMKAHG